MRWGRFRNLPKSLIQPVLGMNLQFMPFCWDILWRTYRMRYYQKQIKLPSVSSIGLLAMTRPEPQLYVTSTLKMPPFFQISTLSMRLSSKRMTWRKGFSPSSTLEQLTPQALEMARMNSEGNLRPICTRLRLGVVRKLRMTTEMEKLRRQRSGVGLVEYMYEWLKDSSIGSLFFLVESKAQVRGIFIQSETAPAISVIVSSRNNTATLLLIFIKPEILFLGAVFLLMKIKEEWQFYV